MIMGLVAGWGVVVAGATVDHLQPELVLGGSVTALAVVVAATVGLLLPDLPMIELELEGSMVEVEHSVAPWVFQCQLRVVG